MNGNRMTGEPNQQNPSSVFVFDPYASPYTINWNQSNSFSLPIQPVQSNNSLQQAIANTVTQSGNIQTTSTPPNNVFQYQLPPAGSPALSQTQYNFGASKSDKDVVHFPFQVTNYDLRQRSFQHVRCKRKTDSPSFQQAKQHITEEKMAEHMSNLHISSESASSSKESDSARTQRLYMCEEMRKLQSDSILPQSLLSQIQRPCTALVLWKPPTRFLPAQAANNFEVDVFHDNENNNEESHPDNNTMDDELEMENANDPHMDMDNS